MRWLGPGTNAAEEDQLPALGSERFHGVDALRELLVSLRFGYLL